MIPFSKWFKNAQVIADFFRYMAPWVHPHHLETQILTLPICPSVSPSVCRLHCKQSCGPPAAAGQQQHHISISQRMWAQRGLPGRRVLFCAYWHHRSTLCVSLITAQRLSRAADRRLSDRHCFLGTRDFLFIFWQLGICIGVFLNKI